MDRMEPPRLPEDRYRMTAPTLGGFAGAAAILMAAAVIVGSARHVLPESVAILLFLTAVLISAAGFGFWVGIISAVGALAGFNFMYVEPHFTLHIARPQDIIKLGIFLLAAAITGLISGRLREQVDAAQGRAAALEVLSRVSTDLALAGSQAEVARVAVRHLNALAHGPAVALAPVGGQLRLIAAEPQDYLPEASELEAADVAFRRGRPEFASAQGWSGSRLTFYPVGTGGPGHGPVLGHARIPQDQRDHGWREQAIEVILRQTGQALQRLALTEEAEAERRRATSEEMRAALLASLSHDLRTPLATILGSVTTLRELGGTLSPSARTDLLAAIEEEAERLARYVEKLLQLTRLQSGMEVNMAWVDAGDAAQAAVARARRSWPQARIEAEVPPLPMLRAEAGLLEQAIFNLIENAVKYAPGPIRVSAGVQPDRWLALSVADQGPGLPGPVAEWLASDAMARPPQGAGLGLPISKGIAAALGGRLVARRGPGGAGAVIEILLPVPPARGA